MSDPVVDPNAHRGVLRAVAEVNAFKPPLAVTYTVVRDGGRTDAIELMLTIDHRQCGP